MKEKAGNCLFIEYSSVKEIFNRRIHNVPKVYHFIILEEMIELKIIRKIGNKKNFRYEFIAKDLDKLLNRYSESLF